VNTCLLPPRRDNETLTTIFATQEDRNGDHSSPKDQTQIAVVSEQTSEITAEVRTCLRALIA
jgi:hypothetical protein